LRLLTISHLTNHGRPRYWLAVETGLRAGELRSLMRDSFALEADPQTVTVETAYSKHRREDRLPLRPPLRLLLARKLSSVPLLRIPTERKKAGPTVPGRSCRRWHRVPRRGRPGRRFPRPAAYVYHEPGKRGCASQDGADFGSPLHHQPDDGPLFPHA